MGKENPGLVSLEQELSRLGVADSNATLGKAKRDHEGQEKSVRRLRGAKDSQVNNHKQHKKEDITKLL